MHWGLRVSVSRAPARKGEGARRPTGRVARSRSPRGRTRTPRPGARRPEGPHASGGAPRSRGGSGPGGGPGLAITRGPAGRFRSRPGTRVPARRPSAGSFTAGGGIIAPTSLRASLNLRAVAATAPGPALRSWHRPTGSRDLVPDGGRTGARCCRAVTQVPRRRSSARQAVTLSESVPGVGRDRCRLGAKHPSLQQPLVLAATPREAKRGAPACRCCPGGA